LLLAVEPPGEDDKQELPGLHAVIPRSPNAAEEQEKAASGVTFHGSIGRKTTRSISKR
jgi:hypothetical protein